MRKIISILTALVLIVSMCTVSVLATTDGVKNVKIHVATAIGDYDNDIEFMSTYTVGNTSDTEVNFTIPYLNTFGEMNNYTYNVKYVCAINVYNSDGNNRYQQGETFLSSISDGDIELWYIISDLKVKDDSVDGTIITTLVPDDDAVTAPNTTFTYTVTKGDADTDANPEIFEGIEAANITVTDAEFTTDDILGVDEDKFEKQSQIDFSEVTFTKPGVYHYVLTAQENYDNGIVICTARKKDAYVYVEYDQDENLIVKHIVIYNEDDDKSDEFVNQYVSKDLEITKVVSGEMANRNQAFTFTLTEGDNIHINTIFKVDNNGTTEHIAWNGQMFVTATYDSTADEYTIGTEPATFELKNGQTYKVLSVVEGMSITVAENEYKGYVTTVMTEDTDAVDGLVIENVINGNVNTVDKTTFTNTYDSLVPPTGVVLNLLPFVLMVMIAGSLIVVRVVRPRKR